MEGIRPADQRILHNGRDLHENEKFFNVLNESQSKNQHFVNFQFSLRGGCRGGKGGFGSLLRSAKSMKKTTNFGSCRDINGRRLRDVEQEKRLNEWKEQKEREKDGNNGNGDGIPGGAGTGTGTGITGTGGGKNNYNNNKKQRRREEQKRRQEEKGEGKGKGKGRKREIITMTTTKKEEENSKLQEKRRDVVQNVNSAVEKGLVARKKIEMEKKRKREAENKPKARAW